MTKIDEEQLKELLFQELRKKFLSEMEAAIENGTDPNVALEFCKNRFKLMGAEMIRIASTVELHIEPSVISCSGDN